MNKQIESAIKDLVSSLQIARLYTTSHLRFLKFIDKAYESVAAALDTRQEIVIGIIEGEISFENEIFFDLSKSLLPIIAYLKDRGIERISISKGVTKEEIIKFVEFLALPKDEVKADYLERLSAYAVKNISVGKLKASNEDPGKSLPDGAQPDRPSETMAESLEAVLDGNSIDSFSLRFMMTNIIDDLSKSAYDLLKLSTIKRYDPTTFMHSLNVSILSMFFSSKLGFAKEDVLDLGLAALFHDIGKLYISRNIIQKRAKLTDEEYNKIKSHTLLGAEVLLKYTGSIGILPVVVAFEHHLKYDLTGYPKMTFFRPPHIASQIVSICDIYDALSQKRNYKNDYPPDMIYKIMIKDKNTAFEPELIEKFFSFVGVWPIGSIIVLSDNRTAVVREENEDDIFCPNIEVILPEEKKERIDLRRARDTLKIEKFVNPWKEGKDLLNLI